MYKSLKFVKVAEFELDETQVAVIKAALSDRVTKCKEDGQFPHDYRVTAELLADFEQALVDFR